MSNPGKVISQVFRFARNSLFSRHKRFCSVFATKAFHHSCVAKAQNNSVLPKLVGKDIKLSPVNTMGGLSPNDPSSYSRPEYAIIKHVSLALNVNFTEKVLSGTAQLRFEALQDIDEVVLDVKNLNIQSIELADGTALNYNVDGHIENFGSKLTINLPYVIEVPGKSRLLAKKEPSEISKSALSTKVPPKSSELLKEHSELKTLQSELKTSQSELKTSQSELKTSQSELSSQKSELRPQQSEPRNAQSGLRSQQFELTEDYSELPKESTEVKKVSSRLFSYFIPDEFIRLRKQAEKHDDSCQSCQCDSPDNKIAETKAQDSPETKAEQQQEVVKKIVTDTRFEIKIKYSTAPDASALQWLEPSQTSGKKHPYLFSQCQPIHARSILPCQDSPAVKFTYDAQVTAPEEFSVLMSALRKGTSGNVTTFEQPTPIPSYLLALAVGVLEHKVLGPRTIVWTEKKEIERAAWEFNETEKFLQAAENLCGDYVWGQYDLLVLPPSFPYGGMENPCLTFVTPTLLAGDRSQADVIVHEIMHSWTGNLVTNRNFEHFWLNEGFTVFLERKVAASLIADPEEARRSRDFHSLLGLQELSEAINEELSGSKDLTKLVVNLDNVHPDDAFSTVPYEKGSLFLRYLEDLVGGPATFDGFLRSYLERFARQSIVTSQFKEHLLGHFEGSPAHQKLQAVDWDSWLHQPGMPPVIPDYDNSMTKPINALLSSISDTKHEISPGDVAGFTPHQIVHLLQELIEKRPLPIDRLEALGEEYGIASSKNSEIEYRWLRLCVRSKHLQKLQEVFIFINNQGRMKYVRPLYRDLYAWEEVRQSAIDNFLANEQYMMHVSAYTIRKDLKLSA